MILAPVSAQVEYCQAVLVVGDCFVVDDALTRLQSSDARRPSSLKRSAKSWPLRVIN